MALLDKAFKQRIVGALVLVALAVIFLPMLLSRQEESRRDLQVDAPAMPAIPPAARIRQEPVDVPVALLPDEPVPVEADAAPVEAPVAPQPAAPVAKAPAASTPVVSVPATQPPVAAAQPADSTASRLDADILPVSWSIQLASLSSSENAQKLQQELRNQGYNAYIRTVDGMNRVFVGPVIERAEANRLRDLLNRQKKLSGIVVRFQPERS